MLLRLGVRRWLAACATAPFLLDAFQLLIEQSLLSELLFELLLVGACAVLLWRRPVRIVPAAMAGLLFAVVALTRPVGAVVALPAVAMLVFAKPRSSRLPVALALVTLFALPLSAYAVWFHALRGEYALTGTDGHVLYARVAPFADCRKFAVPANERLLCPTRRVSALRTPQDFAWSKHSSWFHLRRRGRNAAALDFARRVIRHQPAAYMAAIAADFVHGFAPTRSTPGRRVPFSRAWQSRPTIPSSVTRFRRSSAPMATSAGTPNQR